MSEMNDKPGTGIRRRVEIEGERYYFIATREQDGTIAFSCTVPDENKPAGRQRRITADRTCEILSEMANQV